MRHIYIILLLISLLFNCAPPNLSQAREEGKIILNFFKIKAWNSVWERSSLTFKKKYSLKYKKLQEWVEKDLGYLKKYEEKYLYFGNNFIIGGYFVKIRYKATFGKGIGEIEITLIFKNNKIELLDIEITKKPDI